MTICFANKGTKDQVQSPVEGTCAHRCCPMNLGVANKSITWAVRVARVQGTRSCAQVMRTAPPAKICARKVPCQLLSCFLVQLALLPQWLPIRLSLAAQCLGEGISALFITNTEPRGKRVTRHQNVQSGLGKWETKNL